MKPHLFKLTLISIILILVSSCMPTSPTSVIENTATLPPSPTAIIADKTPVMTETPIPTQAQVETPTVEAVASTIPINVNNAAGLVEIGRASQTNPRRLVWRQDGAAFGVISQRQVVIYDVETLNTSAVFSIEEPGQLLDFSSDGKTAAVTTDQMSLDLYDATSNSLLRTIDFPDMVYGAAFSPDGQIIAIASFSEIAAMLFEVSSGNLVTKLSGFSTAAPVYDISFASDGKSIIWHARGGVQLQEISSGQMGPPFEHEDFVSGIAVSPDGRVLATGAAGTFNNAVTPLVTLWDTHTGQEMFLLPTKTVAYSLYFSPDSRLLAGGLMTTLIIWDTETSDEILSKDITAESISSVSFSPNGSYLAVTASDNSIQLWQVSP